MKLSDIDLYSFIPEFMKSDKDTQAFIYAIQGELVKVISDIKYADIYSRIDQLDEEVLDILADQFSISEYNTTYAISIKRSLIKNCMLVHHQRGTVSAVEKVVKDVFGDARVEEWFDYGGEPYHFRVFTSNASATDEMLEEFERLINLTQNCRSYLESATIELYQSMDVNVGITCAVGSIDTFQCNM